METFIFSTVAERAMAKNKLHLLYVSLVIIALFAASTQALDPMGPPTASLQKGQISAGLEYSDTRMDIEAENGRIVEELYQDGVLAQTTVTEIGTFEIKNLKMHKTYANVGYGIRDNVEGFVRVGKMNTEFSGDFFSSASRDYNGDSGDAIGLGAKVTLYEKDRLKLGGLLQMSWGSSEADWANATSTESITLDVFEMQVALGATYQATQKTEIYGGPFWHFIGFSGSDADGRKTLSNPSQGEEAISSADYDLDDIHNFGGYLGARIRLLKDTYCCVEYQHTPSAQAIGLSLKRWF